MRRSFCCILAIAVLSIAGIYALPAVSGDGRVVLTVVGDVKITNRGGRDNFTDKLITFQGSEFDRAMEFDDAALWALGTRKIKVSYPDWSEAHEFEGPLLKDVLAAAGISGGTLQPVGLDGYAAEIPYSDLEKWPVIVSLKIDGRWLPVGGAGPSWVVYPRDDFPELASTDDAKWVWGVSHIRVIGGR